MSDGCHFPRKMRGRHEDDCSFPSLKKKKMEDEGTRRKKQNKEEKVEMGRRWKLEKKRKSFGDCKMKESKVEIKMCRIGFVRKKKEDDINPAVEKI